MKQQYLVIMKDNTVFNTDWYEYHNHWGEEHLMIVHISHGKVTTDGFNWIDIEEDHL